MGRRRRQGTEFNLKKRHEEEEVLESDLRQREHSAALLGCPVGKARVWEAS